MSGPLWYLGIKIRRKLIEYYLYVLKTADFCTGFQNERRLALLRSFVEMFRQIVKVWILISELLFQDWEEVCIVHREDKSFDSDVWSMNVMVGVDNIFYTKRLRTKW